MGGLKFTYQTAVDGNAFLCAIAGGAGALQPLRSCQIDEMQFGGERLQLRSAAAAAAAAAALPGVPVAVPVLSNKSSIAFFFNLFIDDVSVQFSV